jgi:hypothetical protein
VQIDQTERIEFSRRDGCTGPGEGGCVIDGGVRERAGEETQLTTSRARARASASKCPG